VRFVKVAAVPPDENSASDTVSVHTYRQEFVPVDSPERIAVLDILRGFGLFGVLWSNLNEQVGAPFWYDSLYGSLSPAAFREWRWPLSVHVTTISGMLAWTQAWLIHGRFYTLLGFLFGIGFAIQLRRAEKRGEDVRKMFYRRVAALLVLGMVNGTLIFVGDILTSYAIVGLFLPLYARLYGRRLLTATAATFLILPYVLQKSLDLMQIRFGGSGLDSALVYGHGTYAQITAARVQDFFLHQAGYVLGDAGAPAFLTLFLLGLCVERTGVISKLSQNLHLVRRTFWVGLLCAAAAFVLAHYFTVLWPEPVSHPALWYELRFWSPRFLVQSVLGFWSGSSLFVWGTTAVYAAALTLLTQRSSWRRRLEPLAAVGRMPLTTYLAQCIVLTVLFYGYGLGWYGRFGLTEMFVITFILFPLQMAFSIYWLSRFRFGPAEWLWRSLSYGSAQPMKAARRAVAGA
jgi:uncharacterized protein